MQLVFPFSEPGTPAQLRKQSLGKRGLKDCTEPRISLCSSVRRVSKQTCKNYIFYDKLIVLVPGVGGGPGGD